MRDFSPVGTHLGSYGNPAQINGANLWVNCYYVGFLLGIWIDDVRTWKQIGNWKKKDLSLFMARMSFFN